MDAERKLGLHWYAWILAVAPTHQGRGFGRALMAHTFDRAGDHALYLETATERAVAIHEHHGYRVLTDAPIPGTTTRIWTMARPPGLPASHRMSHPSS